MSQIFDSNKITSNQQKLCEVDDIMILHAQQYNKHTWKPIKNAFAVINCDSAFVMGTSKVALIPNDTWNFSIVDATWHSTQLVDSEDSSIIYKVTPRGNAGTAAHSAVTKFKVNDDGTLSVLARYNPAFTSNEQWQFLGQSKTHLFIRHTNSLAVATSNYILYVPKDLSMYTAQSNSGWHSNKIIESEGYMFLFFETTNNSYHYDVYNKGTYTNTTLSATDLIDGVGYMTQVTTDCTYKVEGTTYDFYHVIDGAGAGVSKPYTPCLKKMSVDTSTVSYNAIADCTVDFTKVDISDFKPHGSYDSRQRTYDLKGIKINNEDYILMTLLSKHYTHATETSTSGGGVGADAAMTYLLKKTGRTSFECVSYYKHPTAMAGILYGDNGSTFVLGAKNRIQILSINSSTLKIELKRNIDISIPQVQAIGMDTNDNIYYQTTDTAIEKIDSTAGVSVIINYEKDYYESQTLNEISTYLEVGIQDIFGRYRNAEIKIRLIGNQTFDDGSKVKTISTSSGGLTNVPVILKGEGLIDFAYTIIN